MSRNANQKALSCDINPGKVRQVQKKIEENSTLIEELVNRIVDTHCKPLDDFMKWIRDILSDHDNPPTDRELDDMTLTLPNLLYFTGEALESVGIKEDIAKAIKMELYNTMYDQADGTISDKTAIAELNTQIEHVTWVVYQRAYKKIRLRMDAGNEQLQSVKKVVSRRMAEYDLTRVAPDRIGGVKR